ncbi:hypothetical protein QBC34DRAFT_390642 [Podospora aff. communis PSN243]|uniref:Uncharacterized protein n=1 Tax=Podospora aff. communis PSN243 TaxID=3040156 RepID=A0AAV9H6K4_9PEZI|nr:hypothetical protein QBC34DRAFT_390642 [Podospora aff. communis PSN243]
MAPLFSSLLKLLCLSQLATANVEKTIFLGPEAVPVPLAHPTLEDLHIDTLTPQENWSLRTRISAKFPSQSSPQGDATWLLLDNLQPGRRYEVRICWAATQPTSFTLRTHELSAVFDSPDLITSLWAYSTTRQPVDATPKPHGSGERRSSVLFLEILAAADFFTTNTTLMQNPPLVEADIILDPFMFNVLPRSLVPTIGYIVVVAAGSLMIARWIVAHIRAIASTETQKQKKHQ